MQQDSFAYGKVDPHEAGKQGGHTSGSGTDTSTSTGGNDGTDDGQYKPSEHDGLRKDGQPGTLTSIQLREATQLTYLQMRECNKTVSLTAKSTLTRQERWAVMPAAAAQTAQTILATLAALATAVVLLRESSLMERLTHTRLAERVECLLE